ncbi:hypothetical protein PN498_19660 [Oscillatoria sp. CS-180]|uniref:hypothetical protein n=1 Tax=Oscillatoria sp. CS-180 TaxID=3021720 RepID=UPI00232B8E6E|nr:hypothetical protein [Oscillatoria sp. CS-180]MDB9528219.1 hypothetical protein [Oscillatoria sp. CS-180]
MLRRFRRWWRYFFRRTSTVNSEPINKVSLIVIVLVDLFILGMVFSGLSDVGHWPISPAQQHPCYANWSNYRTNTDTEKDIELIRNAVPLDDRETSLQSTYRSEAEDHLGQVSDLCLQYASYWDQLNTSANREVVADINQRRTTISDLEAANRQIRDQYDSTLLEDIAGQPRDRSINEVEAAEAKRTFNANTAQIETLREEISILEVRLIQSTESQQLVELLKSEAQFASLENPYNRATFWHPTVEIIFQGLFLLPLITISWLVHRSAQRNNHGLVALLSWHLLVIFLVPLIIRLFQIFQIGALFSALTAIANIIFGSLLFLISYVYILLIPLVGFGLIKFLQKIVFNPKVQASGRVQKSRCIRCARKLTQQDHYCPHCGYNQLQECGVCHQQTYRLLPYCRECGAPQTPQTDRTAS